MRNLYKVASNAEDITMSVRSSVLVSGVWKRMKPNWRLSERLWKKVKPVPMLRISTQTVSFKS